MAFHCLSKDPYDPVRLVIVQEFQVFDEKSQVGRFAELARDDRGDQFGGQPLDSGRDGAPERYARDIHRREPVHVPFFRAGEKVVVGE